MEQLEKQDAVLANQLYWNLGELSKRPQYIEIARHLRSRLEKEGKLEEVASIARLLGRELSYAPDLGTEK